MTADNDLTRSRHLDIVVATPPDFRLTCGRCADLVVTGEVALYTRTRPGDPFEPWCVDCALTLIEWAALGAAGVVESDN